MTKQEFKQAVEGFRPQPGMEYRVRRAVLERQSQPARPRTRRLQGGVIAACCCVLLAVLVGISSFNGSFLHGLMQPVDRDTLLETAAGKNSKVQVQILEPGNRFIATCEQADEIRVAATGGSLQPPYIDLYAVNCVRQTVKSGDPFEWTPEEVADGEETFLSFTPYRENQRIGQPQYVRVVYHAGDPAAYESSVLEDVQLSPVIRIYEPENFAIGRQLVELREPTVVQNLKDRLNDAEKINGQLDVGNPDYLLRSFASDRLPGYEELYLWKNDDGSLMSMYADDAGTGYRVKGINAQELEALLKGEGDANSQFNPDDDIVLTTPQACYPLDSEGIPINLANRSEKKATYGAGFSLYRKVEGGWSQVQFDASWNSLGYLLDPGGNQEELVSFQFIEWKEPLTPGVYCIVKQFTIEEQSKRYAVQFALGDGVGYPRGSQNVQTSDDALRLRLQNDSESVDVSKLSVRFLSSGEKKLSIGRGFTLEKQIDGEWYAPFVREGGNSVATDAIIFTPGQEFEMVYSLKDRYDQPLTPGHYRVVVPVYEELGSMEPNSQMITSSTVSHQIEGPISWSYGVEFDIVE